MLVVDLLVTSYRVAITYKNNLGGNMQVSRSFIFLLLCIQFLTCGFVKANIPSNELQIAIFGLGGRAQDVLAECIQLQKETGKTIHVVAVCDNSAKESYDFYVKNRIPNELFNDYAKAFESVKVYSDNEEGIISLLQNHPNVNRIFITSPNNRHAVHLQAVLDHSACQNIYLEKPLFKTIEEFSQFNRDLGNRNIQVGLTLRSAKITSLAAQHLKLFKSDLGKLKKVHSYEHVNFGHGLSIIMMNWRRYISLSGGLLIEKSVHDLDLASFFMEAVDVHPKTIDISTKTQHNFYKKSNKQLIIDRLLADANVRKSAEVWDLIPWQRAINFSYDSHKKIDWQKTMDNFFEEFPEDADLDKSDIIPDTQVVRTRIKTTLGDEIYFELDLKLNGFETQTERGTNLFFENGQVIIDMESSKMHVQVKNKVPIEIDLKLFFTLRYKYR